MTRRSSACLLGALVVLLGALVFVACGPNPPASCSPTTEVCDEKDNDCDGATDEDGVCDESCTDGATECVGSKWRSCIGGGWSSYAGCSSGFCDAEGFVCGTCSDECAVEGQGSCADGKARTCTADEHGCLAWGDASGCKDGFCLNAASCGACATECTPGVTRCQDGKLQTCVDRPAAACGTWGAQSACPDGVCASASACGTCSHGCSAVSASECADGKIRSCVADADGCRAWGAWSDCGSGACATAQTCSGCNNGCPAGGQTDCSQGQTRTCQADAKGCLAWSTWTACADGFCSSTTACGTCNQGCSPAGATSCASGKLKTCVADGNGCRSWSSETACADGFCSSTTTCGTCNHLCPTLNATSCADGKLKTCKADGNGCRDWSSETACADGFCASATACGACSHGCAVLGASECSGGQLRTCESDANGCRRWSGTSACPEGACSSATACGPRPVLVISELRYDSTSSPDVESFVEVHGTPGTSLAGLTLVGVNGNGGADYNAIALTGAIPSSGYFLVAHPNGGLTAIANQLSSNVDYQNGPDSVQLRQGTFVIDAVGYGSFASAVFGGEGTPAPTTPVNWSLSRDSQDRDTNDNLTDFSLVGTPTPGRAADTADAGTPGLDAGAPRPDAAAPGADAGSPGLDAAAPGLDAAAPGPDAAAPGLDAAAPGRDAAAPGLDAAAPGRDAAVPGLDAAAPGLDAAAPGLDAAAPGLDAAAPGPDAGAPSNDPYDPGSCTGTLSETDATALLGGQSRKALADFTLVHRTRTCDASGNCGAWSASSTYLKTLCTYSGGVTTRYKTFSFPTKLVLWGSAGARKLTVRETNDYNRANYDDSSGVVFSLGNPGPVSYPTIQLWDPFPQSQYDYQDFPVTLGDQGYLYTGSGCARFYVADINGGNVIEEVVGLYRF